MLLLLPFPLLCRAKIDSTYIDAFSQNTAAKFFLGNKFTSLTYQPSGQDPIVYNPDAKLDLGIGLSWKGWGGSISYGIGLGEKRTESFDWQYHHYNRHFMFDVYGQFYKGFSFENSDNEEVAYYPDMKISKLDGLFLYGFNGNKYSFRAAFNQSEKQLRSAGSFLLGANVDYTKITLPEGVVSDRLKLKHNFFAGPAGGYTYTWVIKERYYISALAVVGFNLGIDDLKNEFDVYPAVFPRLSAGYNAETWSISISGIFNNVYVSYANDENLSINTGTSRITFVKRFDFNPSFLKKK